MVYDTATMDGKGVITLRRSLIEFREPHRLHRLRLRLRRNARNSRAAAREAVPVQSRAERELASTAVSRVNGCVYCASVHAQRFTQLAKRTDAIDQVFDDPSTAGTTARERAIIRYAIALTERPDTLDENDIAALEAEGLTHEEILDLSHAIAIFAWANRLMLTLGEPVFPEPATGS
ncbi:peroxidase-related enzyme [Burkholderia sp. AW33-5]